MYLDFLEPYRYTKINDDTVEELSDFLRISRDTYNFERIKGNFENICLYTNLMRLPVYTMNQNRLCTNILHSFLAINLKRETVLNELISKLHQSIEKRQSVEGYLSVAAGRKEDMILWIRNKITTNLPLACPLFVIDIGNWNSSIYKENVLNFIKNVDPSLGDDLNRLTAGHCQDVVQNNVREHCQCDERGSTFFYCDMSRKRKCPCKELHTGDKCQDDPSKQKGYIFDINILDVLPAIILYFTFSV